MIGGIGHFPILPLGYNHDGYPWAGDIKNVVRAIARLQATDVAEWPNSQHCAADDGVLSHWPKRARIDR